LAKQPRKRIAKPNDMKKIKLEIIINIDDAFFPMNNEEKDWFEKKVLNPEHGGLALSSVLIGDYIGDVTECKIINWLNSLESE
jgi:hypothetical protein